MLFLTIKHFGLSQGKHLGFIETWVLRNRVMERGREVPVAESGVRVPFPVSKLGKSRSWPGAIAKKKFPSAVMEIVTVTWEVEQGQIRT